MSDYEQFALGNTIFPLTSSLSQDLVDEADPVLYAALNFLSGVLCKHLGPAWRTRTSAAGRNDLSSSFIATKVPYDPTFFQLEDQFQLPMLALYRKGGQFRPRTLRWNELHSDFELLLVLPPCDAALIYQLNPFLKAAVSVINDRLEQGWDPNYLSGQQVFRNAGCNERKLGRFQFMSLASTNAMFPTLRADLAMSEREQLVTGSYANLEGVDISVNVAVSGSAAHFSGSFEVSCSFVH